MTFWCLHCETAFQAEEMPRACPTEGCDGSVLDFQEAAEDGLLSPWPSHWPAELVAGERYPLYER